MPARRSVYIGDRSRGKFFRAAHVALIPVVLDDRYRYIRDSWTAAVREAHDLARVRAVNIFRQGRQSNYWVVQTFSKIK